MVHRVGQTFEDRSSSHQSEVLLESVLGGDADAETQMSASLGRQTSMFDDVMTATRDIRAAAKEKVALCLWMPLLSLVDAR